MQGGGLSNNFFSQGIVTEELKQKSEQQTQATVYSNSSHCYKFSIVKDYSDKISFGRHIMNYTREIIGIASINCLNAISN